MLIRLAAMKAVPITDIDQRQLDEEPEGEQTYQGPKGEGGAGGLGPHEEIEDEHRDEEEAGKEESGLLVCQLGFWDHKERDLAIKVFFLQFMPPNVLYTLPEK